MSLNRAEQGLFDYVLGHAEERQHWQTKVRDVMRGGPTIAVDREAAAVLADELWHYYLERAETVREFREARGSKEVQRISMRNLAEHLLRMWGPAKPAREKG